MAEDARCGICCAGNWIIDHVKTVDAWPQEQSLASILAEDLGTGGSPYNVAIDLARFGARFPIRALGLVGDDSDGRFIRDDIRRLGIDDRLLQSVPDAPTAYTDVISVQATGRRTFFHQRGANALLAPRHFPVADLSCRILTLGYLLLLDGLDAADSEHGTGAARVLADCQVHGVRTAVDLVSEDSDRFGVVVTPALRHTDYLVINEIEASRTSGCPVRGADEALDRAGMEAAADDLVAGGVRQLVVIHAPEAALAVAADGTRTWRESLALPDGFVQGAAGAGDAFFAGVMMGVHEAWDVETMLGFAHGAAATCLRHPTCTGGIGSAAEIAGLVDRWSR